MDVSGSSSASNFLLQNGFFPTILSIIPRNQMAKRKRAASHSTPPKKGVDRDGYYHIHLLAFSLSGHHRTSFLYHFMKLSRFCTSVFPCSGNGLVVMLIYPGERYGFYGAARIQCLGKVVIEI